MEDPSFTLTLVHQIPPEVLYVLSINKVLEIFKKTESNITLKNKKIL